LVTGTPEPLKTELIRLLGEAQVLHRLSDLVRYASDASPYRLLPQVVVQPRHVDDIVAILESLTLRPAAPTGCSMTLKTISTTPAKPSLIR
jgi:hypothetical protein